MLYTICCQKSTLLALHFDGKNIEILYFDKYFVTCYLILMFTYDVMFSYPGGKGRLFDNMKYCLVLTRYVA